GTPALVHPYGYADLKILSVSARRDPVLGKARVGLDRPADGNGCVFGARRLRVGEQCLADLEGFVSSEHHRAAVLRTVTWRNRAGVHPWMIASVWLGSSFPSAEVPHSRYLYLPPIPSHEAQKSGVRDW